MRELEKIEALKTLKRVYNNQKSNCTKYKRAKPSYSFIQFALWSLADRNFKAVFYDWRKTGALGDKPSCDRVDSKLGYQFGNLEWVTWTENQRRNAADRVAGRGNAGNCCKTVTDGKQVYHSIAEAARRTGINVKYYVKKCNSIDPEGRSWRYV